MNTIINGSDRTIRGQTPDFQVNEKGKREKSRMDKSKENANIYPYAHMHVYTYIYTQTYTYIHIIYYSSQVVLFDIMFDSI